MLQFTNHSRSLRKFLHCLPARMLPDMTLMAEVGAC